MTMIRKIEPWKGIYKSWYSQEFYREVAHRWRGLGYRYLILVLLGLWLIASAHVHIVVHEFLIDYLKPMMLSMPKMDIKDGVLTLDRKARLIQVRDPRNGRLIVNFDLTEKPRQPPLDEDGIYLEERRVIFHMQGKEQIYDFAKIKDTNLDWSYYVKAVDAVSNWTGIVIFGLFWLSSFILCALQALLYGLAGKLIAAIAKRRLTYPQLVRIAVVALTPPLIIDTCQKLFSFGIPAWPLVSVAMTLGFLIYGVKVNSVSFEWSLTQGVPKAPVEKNSTV